MLKLANTVLILINPSPSNVNDISSAFMNYKFVIHFLGGRNFSSQTCLHFEKLVHGIVSNDGMLLLLQTAQSTKL